MYIQYSVKWKKKNKKKYINVEKVEVLNSLLTLSIVPGL